MRFLLLVLSLCMSTSAIANWQVDNDKSTLNFTSVKKNSIGEIHSFKQLSGMVTKAGAVKFAIDLTSVATGIEIRDQRMKNFLFETDKFATATFAGQVNGKALNTLAVGQETTLTLQGGISLHGQTQQISIPVKVVKLAGGDLSVHNIKPLVIQAEQYALTKGLMKLQELASLPSISPVVPVHFSLHLTKS